MKIKFTNFLKTYWIILTIVFAPILTAFLLVKLNLLETGFDTYKTVSTEIQKTPNLKIIEVYRPEKTLWDWMQLFIIPVAIAIIGVIFSNIQKKREEQIAESTQFENAFQIYLKNISDLILEKKLLDRKKDAPECALAYTFTQAAMHVLDSHRKGRVIRFLYDTGLIKTGNSIISCTNLDLSKSDLRGFECENADLSSSHLEKSDFRGAVLRNVDLSKAFLKDAMLRDADFTTAILTETNFEGAIYDYRTKWPQGFKPKDHKLKYDNTRRPIRQQ